MRSVARFRGVAVALCMVFIGGLVPVAQARPAETETALLTSPPPPDSPTQTAPDVFIPSHAASFSVYGSRLVWHRPAYCPSPPPRLLPEDSPAAAADPVTIDRIPTYGGTPRRIFSRNDPREPGLCNQYFIRSNVVSDATHVYWVDDSGLVRLSVNANPGDAPELLNSAVRGPDVGNIAVYGDYVYGHNGGNLWRIQKNGPNGGIALGSTSDRVTNLQVDEDYVYYILDGALIRLRNDGSEVRTLATDVTGYYAEDRRVRCDPVIGCFSSYYVYVAQGRSISIYNNTTNAFTAPRYTSSDPQATVHRMTSTRDQLFIFETRFIPCSPQPCVGGTYNDVLLRSSRLFSNPVPLYARTSNLFGIASSSWLTTDGTFLFWQELPDVVRRLPADAAALPVVDVVPTSIEITQGVQRNDNSVLLVQNRRTFVRVFVRSASGTVNGVTMALSGSWSAGGEGGGVIWPVNNVGKNLNVSSAPDPNNIDHAFLFDLPWEWTTKSDLRLRAEINPHHFPLEPNYSNNVLQGGPFNFRPSPRLAVQYISFGYELNGTTYYPRLIQDVFGNYSYLRRTYPLASTPGNITNPSPGFRPNLWIMFDDGLADRILQPDGTIRAAECSRAPFLIRDSSGTITTDNRNLCASAYINSRLKQIRAEEGLDSSIFMYGMISDGGGFPRGQEGGDRVSSGPAGPGWEGYYAAHEVGHSLGRPHPNSGSDDPATTAREGCEHSRSDASYPYADGADRAPIGPNDGSVRGFDVGDREFGAAREVKPATVFNDYMSYCAPYWISDYTYRAMYDYMIANPSKPLDGVHATAPRQAGDWLSIFGVIGADGESAVVHELSRSSDVGTVPPREDGPFAIQLLNAAGGTLAEYAFTPNASEEAEALLSFGQVVPFVANTREIRIVHRASGRVLLQKTVSTHAPTIGNVELANATEPVTGSATLRWTASDRDGDTLSYRVYWSNDGGETFRPIQLDRDTQSMRIDTTQLGGGSGIFRVVASDGIQTTSAESDPITLASKPPTVRITSPGDNDHFEWQQVVNFVGEVDDLQDGTLPDTSLVWRDAAGRTLGTGSLLSKDDLPVGTNRITLTATNSAGLSASDTITITVGDNLELPGPTLSVSPQQIGWTSPNSSIDALQAIVNISNTGADSLAWTATSDEEWLTLSAASGNAPAALTLTADPSDFAASAVRSATVTISATVGDSTQRVRIPVTVWRGSAAFGPPVPAAQSQIFIPLIRR